MISREEIYALYPDMFEDVFCGWCLDEHSGWNGLIHQLCRRLGSKGNPDLRVRQVKEKFGGLCFYTDGGDELDSGIIDGAEAASWYICESCGTTEDVTTEGGWVKTLCQTCRSEKCG